MVSCGEWEPLKKCFGFHSKKPKLSKKKERERNRCSVSAEDALDGTLCALRALAPEADRAGADCEKRPVRATTLECAWLSPLLLGDGDAAEPHFVVAEQALSSHARAPLGIGGAKPHAAPRSVSTTRNDLRFYVRCLRVGECRARTH